MGSHSSKAAKGDVVAQDAAAGDASPSKSNGQENGHVKINGDVSPKADSEAPPLNGNGSAEPVKEEAKGESGSGDAIEPAPVAEGGEAKADGSAGTAASKETPKKKKKKFSFKKSFKLSGISFRKAKKESGDTSAVSSPGEEQGEVEAKGEENQACAAGEAEEAAGATTEEAAPEEQAAAPVEASAPEGQPEEPSKREAGSEGAVKEDEEKQQPPPQSPPGEGQEDTKLAEAEASPVPAEQKEE